MTDISDYENMPLTQVVAQFFNDEKWTDDITVSDDRNSSTVETGLNIENQSYKLYLEANEEGEVFSVYVYTPFNVPPNRIVATAKILNRINFTRLRLGRLAVLENGEPNPIQFGCSIDVEGGTLAPKQIGTVIGVCFSLGRFHQLLSAVALTKMSEDKLWEEFVDEERKSQEEESDGPDQL